MPTTTSRLLRYAWSVVSWIVFSGLVTGIVAALYYYEHAENEIRKVVQSRLAEIYPNLTFQFGSARILQGEGIRFSQISILTNVARGSDGDAELAQVDSLTLQCDASLSSLVQRKVVVRQVVCQGVLINATRRPDGSWNLADLIPAKPWAAGSYPLPRITFSDSSCRLRDLRDAQVQTLNMDDVNLQVRLKRIPGGTLARTGHTGLPATLIAVDGSFKTPSCQRVDVKGVARTTDGAWTLQGDVSEASWSPEKARQLPAFLAEPLQRAGELRARTNFQFQIGRKSRSLPMTYQADGQIVDAHWQDERWSHPISNVSCDFHIDPDGCYFSSLTAALGSARIGGALRVRGHDLTQPFDLKLQLEGFPLTERFVSTLPEKVRHTWSKFRAEGLLTGSLHVQFDGREHRYQSVLTVAELSLVHDKFPYPITNCQGDFEISNAFCQFDLFGTTGGTPIKLHGEIQQPGPRFTGRWEAMTTRWKSIDEGLIAALPANVSDFVRRLQLRGNVGVRVEYERKDPNLRPPPNVIVNLDKAWIKYDQFLYPIHNIQGRLESRDGRWSFEQLRGWNDNCQISCDGYWDTRDSSKPLELNFQLSNVSLDEELKQALRPATRQIWDQLRPQGRLEHVQIRYFKTLDLMEPELVVKMVQGDDRGPGGSPSRLRLQPVWLPLDFSNVQGHAELRGQTFVLRGVSGDHGKLRVRTNGTGRMRPDGRWTLNLSNISIDRLQLTEAVLRALPPRLTHAIAPLGLAGTYSLAGAMRFDREDRTAPVASSWDLAINVEQGQITGSVPTTGVFGQIDVNGASRGRQFLARGHLAIDSLVSQGVQLTAIEGPFWLDSTRVVLGKNVPPETADTPSSPVTATVYDGRVSGNIELLLNRERNFSLQFNVTNASVAKLGRDWQLGNGNLSGRAFLELFLTGSNRGRHTLSGNGTAQLRDASLYELPLVLALLSRLGSGRTDNTAFTTSDVAFHVRDGFVYFDRFDLAGDAITLKGIGEMSLDRQLSLDFYSIVGREQLWNPIVRPFLGEASRQFLQIHVDGTLNNPRTTQKVLPGLNETLQQLFPELAAGVAANRQAIHQGRRGPMGLFPRR